ncbi:MAG TPA: glycerate kinase [Solirubrobacterales bacterium]|nr:glycerate kinase [Solirubrobacterales bacterium]
MTPPPAADTWSPRVLVAPDSFKGSLSQAEVAAAIAVGIMRALPSASVAELPLSDGGEGWLDTLVAADPGGRVVSVAVGGPLGEAIEGRYGLVEDGRTAVVEVATASGLHLVDPSPATFRAASSRGSGELIRAALDAGATRVLVGLGGSATTDGGAGLGVALRARLLDAASEPVGPGGAALAALASADLSGLDPRLDDTEVLAATDVDNPLLGPTGAAAVYGPQKGAWPGDVGPVDAALANFADHVEAALGRELRSVPGAGAAGGLGFGLLAFCGASIVRGIELALDLVGFDAALATADLVITGEGRIDPQTLHGKVVAGVAGRARAAGVPAYAIGGAVDPAVHDEWPRFEAAGLAGVESTLERPMPLAEALDPAGARARLSAAAERLVRGLAAGRG